MKVKIRFPQIVIDCKEVEITEEQYNGLTERPNGLSDFIWDNMSEQERNHTHGKKWLQEHVDDGYIKNIEIVK